jgi:hypothetical protein
MSGIIHSWPIEIDFNRAQIRSRIRESDILDIKSIASYTVFKGADGKIYAKSGDTGQIVASDTDLGVVLQSVVNIVPDFGSATIYIKPGQYDMFTGVRAAKAGLAIIGGWVWDWLSAWERANIPQAYPSVLIRLRADGVKYFDFGWEDPNAPVRPMRIAMIGIGAYASDVSGNIVQHTSSVFIYLRNRVRQSIFRQLFITGVGYGIQHTKTISNANGLQDDYFEHVTCEYPYYKCIDLQYGDYNIRLVDVYAGWNSNDAAPVDVRNSYAVYVDRLWILAGSQRGLRIEACQRVVARDIIIESAKGSNAIEFASVTDGVLDTALVNYDGTNSPIYVLTLRNNINVEIRNVYARYKNNTYYLEGSMPRMINVRFFNVNNNTEYRSENRGVATIPAGQTRVTVTHNLIATPTKFQITPLGQPPGKIWVENITRTSFDIVTDTAPTTNLNVAWYAEI